MPVALDYGGMPVPIGELQAGIEDYSASQSAEFNVEHDDQGRHTKPFQSLEVAGQSQLLGGSILGALLAFEDGYATTLTANTNDLAQPDGAAIEDVAIRLQASSAVDLTGILPADPTRRQVHLIENGGSETITLRHNVTSTYRFSLPGELDVALTSGEVVFVWWDLHSNIWRMLSAGRGVVIESIQRGTVTIAGSSTTGTGTIVTPVDVNKSDLSNLGAYYATGAAIQHIAPGVRIEITNSTTITATRTGGTSGLGEQVTVGWQIVEYA